MQQLEEEQDIIGRVLQGNQHAYALLVDRYRNYVFTIAFRHVNDRELAEELAQDVFIKAYKSLRDFRGTSKFSTWLYTIVHTTCLSHMRKKKDKTVFVEHEQMLNMADRFTESSTASYNTEQRSQKVLLDNAIKTLSPADSEVISLFYQGEQTLEEIGLILGITPNLVKVRLFRARQKLKELLEKRYSRELTG
jgi:RNA polymerase sigma factor (sigma-70 family)